MNNMLNATTLDDSLAEIVSKLQTLMDSFWIYIVMALAAVVVVWSSVPSQAARPLIRSGAPIATTKMIMIPIIRFLIISCSSVPEFLQ